MAGRMRFMSSGWSLLASLCCSFVISMAMSSDTYEASFGGKLLPRTTTNLQTFQGALGGVFASPITNSGNLARPFKVDESTFNDFPSAGKRSCATQFNTCQDLANNGTGTFTVPECNVQQTSCNAAQSTATIQAFQVLFSQDAQFDYICDT